MTHYELEAIHLFNRADLQYTADGLRVLATDLKALAVDELDAGDPCGLPDSETAYQAANMLKERIGGLSNLQGYVNTLLATKRIKRDGK